MTTTLFCKTYRFEDNKTRIVTLYENLVCTFSNQHHLVNTSKDYTQTKIVFVNTYGVY